MTSRTRTLANMALALMVLVPAAARAGLPTDVVLSASEQDADDAMGLTIAKGDAEIVAAGRDIRGRADVIEVWGKGNKVVFRGSVVLTVGKKRYEGATVTCALDFYTCAAIDDVASSSSVGMAATTPQ